MLVHFTVFDSALTVNNRVYVFRYTPDEVLLPSTVTAENFILTDEADGEEVQIETVLYNKYDDVILIYPSKGSISGQSYVLSSKNGLKNSDGDVADLDASGLQPLIRYDAEIYGVSVPYATYKKDGIILYNLKGVSDYVASFEVINTSGTDYSNLGYVICPKTEPQLVLDSGNINIDNNETALINVAVDDYVMEIDDDLIVIFNFNS